MIRIKVRTKNVTHLSKITRNKNGYAIDCREVDEETEAYEYLVEFGSSNPLRIWLSADDIEIL